MVKVGFGKNNHFIFINYLLQKKEMAIVNLSTLNVSIPNFIKQPPVEIRAEVKSNIIIVVTSVPQSYK
jgi:hypothetical protein